MILLVSAALAGALEAEPFVVVAAHPGEGNADARGVGEALNGVHADVAVVTGCSRGSLAEETVAVGGYRLVADGRDPTPTGICMLARVDGDATVMEPPWTAPCSGPIVVGRFSAGEVSQVVIGVHLPSRLPACGGGGDVALKALAGQIEAGRLRADLGPGRAGDGVVVAGNLNAAGRQLAPLWAVGLVDAGGAKPEATWRAGPVGLALDHVLFPGGWSVERFSTFAIPGSAHRGVVAGYFAQ
jgi:hypothetical protein